MTGSWKKNTNKHDEQPIISLIKSKLEHTMKMTHHQLREHQLKSYIITLYWM